MHAVRTAGQITVQHQAQGSFNLADDPLVTGTIIHQFQHEDLSMLQRPTAKYESKPGIAKSQNY